MVFHSFRRWFANRLLGSSRKGSRPRKRARRPLPQLELLEDRLTPSTVSVTDAPQLIPIGNVKAGPTRDSIVGLNGLPVRERARTGLS
jgi:hypothetical protein